MTRVPRLLIVAVLGLVPATAFAVSPILWTLETFEDFEKGKPDGAAVSAAGELVLAPALRPIKIAAMEQSAEPFLWSQAIDSKGTLYVGGGNGGRVYRIPRGAQGSLYFEAGDLAVHALAVDKSDVLYAATLPQGKIYRVTGEAKGEEFYAPEDRYVWALAFSPKGELYAATGERGIVYRVPSRGKGEVFFDSEEFHVVSLAFDAAGNLLAGTDGKGLLYRIAPDGKATVLYDSKLREMNAVIVDPKGVVYASAIGAEGEVPVPPQPLQVQPSPAERESAAPSGRGPAPPPVVIPGVESGPTTTVTVTASAAGGPATVSGANAPKSEVYRIDPDGTVTTVWSSPSEIVYSLAFDSAGRPVAGTGEPGRVRILLGSQQTTLLAKLPESQVTSLLSGQGQQMFAASSNVGRVYVLDPSGGETGTYLSPTCDAQTLSKWGRISWRASVPSGARVELATRSGNSGVPDGTWSDWSPMYASADGSAVSSPPARFLQWRARLARPGTGPGPSLQAVSVAYLQTNLAPMMKRVSVDAPGVVRERLPYAAEPDPEDLAFTGIRSAADAAAPSAQPAAFPEKRVYVRGMRALDWEAEDPNGDVLTYDLAFKGEGETAWKPLARGLRESYFAFDSTQLPDGLYRVRVEASDAPSNPQSQARSAIQVSDPFLVDNTPPVVQVTTKRTGRDVSLDASATDGIGPIARAEYSLDAGRFQPIVPADGVSDSRNETYTLPLTGLRSGEHLVIVKVTDLLGNTGSGKTTFTSD